MLGAWTATRRTTPKSRSTSSFEHNPNSATDVMSTAKADFAKPYHHRVDEGLIQCSDCHNVHGTTTLRQVRSMPSGDAICVKCHADKQGPFVFEHVPVKTEGCSSCHTPHGSTNPRYLAREPGESALPAMSHIPGPRARGTFP